MTVAALRPLALKKEGEDRLVIEWNDGHHSEYLWTHLRSQCPCAGCREERLAPPDPFRILKPSEIEPLKPVSISPVGYYAYKIVWSDKQEILKPYEDRCDFVLLGFDVYLAFGI